MRNYNCLLVLHREKDLPKKLFLKLECTKSIAGSIDIVLHPTIEYTVLCMIKPNMHSMLGI
jgi:hypothetical protein